MRLHPVSLPRLWHIALLFLLGVILPLLPTGYVAEVTSPNRYDDPARVPPTRIGIVFGAGIRKDGSLTPMLVDRVEAAVALYKNGQVRKLLMSGDNSRADYDEVSAMGKYAAARGVPEADVTLDRAGFSTYESCYRARAIFGVTQAILVTQRYHLPRAVYTCRQLGIDAVGLGTPDWGVHPLSKMVPYAARELLSTIKALWDLHVAHPLPTSLGQYEGIG
jgi:vancomycin permeability regulator SanA